MFRQIFGIFLLLPLINSNELEDLTENFFENLEIHLKADLQPDESIVFTDKQVENFVDLIKKRQNADHKKRVKRQIAETPNDGSYDIHTLEGVTPIIKIPAKRPKNLQLFHHELNKTKIWYAAGLQENDELKIFKYNGEKFHQLHHQNVNSAVRLGLFTIPTKGTFIVVAENTTKSDFHEKTAVYRFALNENLEKVQNLHIDYATDVSIWTDYGEIYMAIVQQFQDIPTEPKTLSCETQSTIYKWLGGHFDIVQHINTSCAVRVTPFTIGKSRFIAVANQGAVDGTSDIFSEIFKFDLGSEKFISYQKIATRGANDIKFFGFKSAVGQERPQEYFLVIANMFSKDENEIIDYNINSIAYKYVDGFFLPFQSFDIPGVTEWLPSIGPNGEFVLLAASKFEGLQTYQYNGWKFQLTPNQYTHSSFSAGIRSLQSYNFEDKNVIVIANPENNDYNVFELNFKLQNQVKDHYNSLLNWCRSTVSSLNEQIANKTTENTSKSKRHTNTLGLREVEADLSNDKDQEKNLEFLTLQLQNQQQQIEIIEIKLNGRSLTNTDINIIPGNILARHVIINNEVLFNELIGQDLNDLNIVAFLSGIIPIDSANEKELPRLELQSGTIQNFITSGLKSINGNPAEDLLHKNVDNLSVTDLVINGNFWVTDLQVKGLLNGLKFNSTNVLLREGNQFFLGNLTATSFNAGNVTAKFLNNLNLHTQPQQLESAQAKIFSADTLKVKHLTVGGYMNNVDLPTLDKYALKTSGNQEITGDYIFDDLSMRNFQSNKLNEVNIPADLVRISEGEYFVHQDVQLEQDLNVENLWITGSLNNILALENGGLDVLKKNTTEMQFIDGAKTIQEVELLKPMVLQGKINSESMQELNPVTKISEPLELLGNFVFTGHVTVENELSASDLGTENFALSNLQQNGLKLTETQIPVHLNFTQQLNTEEIFVDTINDIDTHRWVVNGHEEMQYIKGWKTIEGDLTIAGDTNLNVVNQIHVPTLSETILKVEGDQIITGKHEFKNIVAGTVTSPKITLQSQHPLESMLTQNIEQEMGDAFVGQLSIQNLKATNVEVQQDFNGIPLTEMLKDTLLKGQNAKVTGAKVFENVTIETLLSRKSINMNRIPTLIKRGEATTGTRTSLELPDGIQIENIKFGKFLNNMSAESFEKNWLNKGPTQTFVGDQVFDKVVVFGRLQVDSNRINDLDLKRLVEDTVKTNEDFEFEKITFDQSVTSLKKIDLKGHIENLDIENIVADGGAEIETDSLIFKDSVTILTPIELNARVNGFNFSTLCDYSQANENEEPKTLILQNNAVFAKSAIIKNINGKDLTTLESSVWYNDKPANITHLKAENINFVEDVTVEGLVAHTNLQWLRDNYFSKSANQTIFSNINFQEGLAITGNLIAPKANIQSVNEVNLDQFTRTVILQGWDQTFEEPLLADALTINHIEGDYRMNGLNLQTDVMRYDADNIVTGKVTIDNVNVEMLNTSRNFHVQNVDLKQWTAEAILKTGSHKVEGRTVIDNPTVFENGLGLTGLLNMKPFTEDKVLLKSRAQTITGRKTFIATENIPEFKDIKLKGTINGIDFSNLVQNQALKTSDNVFANSMDFNSNLTAQNVNFGGLYQGVNISQLFENLTTNAFIENYYENYDKLRDASRAVQKSLNNQANYLNYFQNIQNFQTLLDIIPMRSFHGDLHLATLRENNHTFILDFFKWVPSSGIFSIDTTMAEIILHDLITYWAPLEYKFGTYLYLEFEAHDENGNTRLGHILSNQNESSYEIIASIPSNGTRRVLPLFLPNVQKTCLLLVHAISNNMDIYCQGEHALELHQRLPIVDALQVEIVEYSDRLEILAIEKNIPEVSLRYERHLSKFKRERYPAVVIWRYDEHTELFNEHQRIFTSTPVSISAVKHNDNEYLAVASGHLVNTMYSGQIDIKKYDPIKKKYTDWQVIRADAPLQVHLSVLPSNELLLYVLRNTPSDMLSVYEYTGIGKFAPLGIISSLEYCNSIHPFNYVWNDKKNSYRIQEHFIIAKCNGVVDIIQSVFKN